MILDRNRGYSYAGGDGTTVSLSTSYVQFAMTEDSTNSPKSYRVPAVCHLTFLEFQLNTIAGGAAALTFKITRDAGGDVPIITGHLSGVTQTIEVGQTTATDGGVGFTLDTEYIADGGSLADETAGSLFVWAKLDAGTAKGVCRLGWSA